MKSKKGVGQSFLIIISIIISILLLTFAGCQSKTLKKDFEGDKERSLGLISEEYPVVFVNTFLESNVLLNLTQKEELNLDIQNEYKIKDILILNSEISRKIIEIEKEQYLNWIESFDVAGRNSNLIYDLYKEDSDLYQIYTREDYLVIEYSNEIPRLEKEIEKDTFMTSLLTLNGEYAIIYFRK